MIRQIAALAFAASTLAAGAAAMAGQQAAALSPAHDRALAAAIAAQTRTPANVARDRYRHPRETLAFFGVEPGDTVVEIWPSGGWYTEILAPYLAQGGGSYYAVAMSDNGHTGVRRLMTANPSLYGQIRLATFPAFNSADTRVPDGTADVVLTFRNVHNWASGYQRNDEPYAEDAFRQMFAMLKPGGTLGVVDHRLPESVDSAREEDSGYIKVSTVRRLAEAAGFRFVGASEVNANPRDTADWPRGVWTLPPTYRLGDQDRERYAAIGESDRMTLRFVKPE
ncbi:methyltransferase domain-containing protein [Sphingosinicella sp. LHD-64]|uniref:class I SAM-dependent methyltransferase n=1 Tax=Sphingosinicella sp. LHD-64 TaxID=3072139 RepID=UPI00280DFB43|nr:methyltransferase domain-containing protein [Sphingosinicella sp. LHD-64]MDQ8757276.1 methyltransferase domain-containing protein [Sphingosinicella sp. LHD-64]